MPFIYPEHRIKDRWLSYCTRALGQHSVLQTKILLSLYLKLEEGMNNKEIMEVTKKNKYHTRVYIWRLIQLGKATSRYVKDKGKCYFINKDNPILMQTLEIIFKMYGKRLSRKDPFAPVKPKIVKQRAIQ